MDRTIRRVTDFEEQEAETYRYWQSRPVSERLAAVDEIVRSSYFAKGVILGNLPSARTLVRVVRPDWKAK